MNPLSTHLGTMFESNMIKNYPERGSKNASKKGTPTTQTKLYLQAGRLLETTPRVRIFNNKTTAWTTTAATTATTAKTTAHVQFLFEVVA